MWSRFVPDGAALVEEEAPDRSTAREVCIGGGAARVEFPRGERFRGAMPGSRVTLESRANRSLGAEIEGVAIRGLS